MTVWGRRYAFNSSVHRVWSMIDELNPWFLRPLQIRVKCNEDDTIGDLKKLVAAQTGTCFIGYPLHLPVSSTLILQGLFVPRPSLTV